MTWWLNLSVKEIIDTFLAMNIGKAYLIYFGYKCFIGAIELYTGYKSNAERDTAALEDIAKSNAEIAYLLKNRNDRNDRW